MAPWALLPAPDISEPHWSIEMPPECAECWPREQDGALRFATSPYELLLLPTVLETRTASRVR